MLTIEERSRMEQRKMAAVSSLAFFKLQKNVFSPHREEMYWGGGISKQSAQVVTDYRNESPTAVMNSFDNAASTGLGNSLEKSSIVYSSLSCNPRILHNSLIHMCKCHGHDDHVFVIITDKCARGTLQGAFKLEMLSVTTMVVDGWTEDYYYPNITRRMQVMTGISSLPYYLVFTDEVRQWCKTSFLDVCNVAMLEGDDTYKGGHCSVRHLKND